MLTYKKGVSHILREPEGCGQDSFFQSIAPWTPLFSLHPSLFAKIYVGLHSELKFRLVFFSFSDVNNEVHSLKNQVENLQKVRPIVIFQVLFLKLSS